MSFTFTQVPQRMFMRNEIQPIQITTEQTRSVEASFFEGVPMADGYVSQIPPNTIHLSSRHMFVAQIIAANEEAHEEAEQKTLQNKLTEAYEVESELFDEDEDISEISGPEENSEEIWNIFTTSERPQFLCEIAKLWTYFLLHGPENPANKGARRHLYKLFLSLRQDLVRGEEEDAKEGGKFFAIFNSALKAERRGRALDKQGLETLKDFAARYLSPDKLCDAIEDKRKQLVFVNKCIELLSPKNKVSFAPGTKPGRYGKVNKVIKQEIDEGIEEYHEESLRRSPRLLH
jgi:hypothetical protein